MFLIRILEFGALRHCDIAKLLLPKEEITDCKFDIQTFIAHIHSKSIS